MAENTTAHFTEQLEVTVKVDEFKRGLDRLGAMWQQFIDKMGKSAEGLVGTGLYMEFKQNFKQLEDIVVKSAEVAIKTAEKVDAVEEKMAAKKSARTKKSVEDAKKAAEEVAKANQTDDEKKAATEAAYWGQKPVARVRSLWEQVGLAQDKALKDKQDLIDREAQAWQRLGQMIERAKLEMNSYFAKREALEGRRVRKGEEVEAAQVSALEEAKKRTLKRIRPGEEVEAAQVSALSAAQRQADQATAAWQRLGQMVERARQQMEAYIRRREAEQSRRVRPGEEDEARLLNDWNAAIREDARRAAAAARRTRPAASASAGPSGPIFPSMNPRDYEQWDRYNTALKTHQKMVQEATHVNKTFFDRVTSGWAQAAATAFKYATVFQVLNLAQEGIKDALLAPFKALQQGVEYLRQLETEAIDIAAIIANNIRFSQDLEENFKKAHSASKVIVRELEELSFKTLIPVETLQSIFRVLANSDANKQVKTFRELIELTGLFGFAVKSSTTGVLAINAAINDIPKLFNDSVGASNKFLNSIKMSNMEWIALRDNARKNGTLIQDLSSKWDSYRRALKAVESSQTLVLKFLELTIKRIKGFASEELFVKLTGWLTTLTQKLLDAGPRIAAFLSVFASQLIQVVETISKFGGEFKALEILSFLIRLIATNALVLSTNLRLALEALIAFKKISSVPFTKDTSFKKELEAYGLAYKKIGQDVAESVKLMWGASDKKTSWDKSILDELIQGLGGTDSESDKAGALNKQLTDLRSKFTSDVEAIKEEAHRVREGLDEDLAAIKISRSTYLEGIVSSYNEEVQQLQKLKVAYEKTFAAIREALLNKKTAKSPQELKEREISLNTQYRDFQKQFAKIVDGERAVVIRERKKLVKEDEGLQKEHFKHLIEINRLYVQQSLDTLQTQRDAGILTEVQYFDQKAELLRVDHELELAILDDSAERWARDSKEYAEYLNKRQALEQKFTNAEVLSHKQRIILLEQEDRKRQEFHDHLRAQTIEAYAMLMDLQELMSPGSTLVGAQDALYRIRAKELNQLAEQKRLQLDVARAKNSESEETRKLTLELNNLHQQRLGLFNNRINEIYQNNPNQGLAEPQVRAEANRFYTELKNESDNKYNDYRKSLLDPKLSVAEIANKAKTAQDAAALAAGFKSAMEKVYAPSIRTSLQRVINSLFGGDFKKAWDEAKGAVGKFGVVANTVSHLLATALNVKKIYDQGSQEGGVLGGIGAVGGSVIGLMSEKMLSKIPVVGQFLPAIMGILSFVGVLFTAAAKKIAEDVKKSFQKTLDNYQNGNITLIQTMQTLEAQRADAIRRLSGKKGGKDQLDQLLPEFDRELQQLKKEQQQIFETFDDSLESLRLNSDTLSQVNKQWKDINKQVRDYVNAGGDANKAAEFLSLQLKNIQETALDALQQAEQEAVQDAIKLNELLEERNKLVADFKKKEFDLINADAMERRQAGSVSRGRELAELRKEHQEQLRQLDEQLRLQNVRVERQKEVFTLVTDIEALHRRDEELTLKALDLQIQKLRDLQSIVKSISIGPGGYAGAGMFAPITVNVTMGSGDDPVEIGRKIGIGIEEELEREARMRPTYA